MDFGNFYCHWISVSAIKKLPKLVISFPVEAIAATMAYDIIRLWLPDRLMLNLDIFEYPKLYSISSRV